MSFETTGGSGPHQGQRIWHAGAPLAEAGAAVILLHGRGASAPDILGLADAFARRDVAYFAPQAAHRTWYPYRFLEPTASNAPYLASALAVVADLAAAIEAGGVPRNRIVLAGFSQGACLALESAARNPGRWGGVVAFSGGLIGTEAEVAAHAGDLAGTPVLIGCSDVDFHIPLERVQASTREMTRLGAVVDERIYPGMGHGINDEEIRLAQSLLAGVALQPARN